MPSSIGHSRRNSGTRPGPTADCQTLVTNDGTTTSEAACAGVVTIARRPIAMVGNPTPTIPFAKPASTKVATVKPSVRTGASIRQLIAGGFRDASSDVAKTGFATEDA